MQSAVSITLIVCGTIVAAMPIIAHKLGLQLADVGSFCYLVLAAVMVLSGIIGSIIQLRPRSARGFEPLSVAAAV